VVLDDVSVTLSAGAVVAIVGENGAASEAIPAFSSSMRSIRSIIERS
jgi:ABC-type hemin transport system ATPase subunit